MSRLTLGGRKRAGGKVHECLRQEEKDDLQQAVTESYDSSSFTPKYTYFLKNLIVL